MQHALLHLAHTQNGKDTTIRSSHYRFVYVQLRFFAQGGLRSARVVQTDWIFFFFLSFSHVFPPHSSFSHSIRATSGPFEAPSLKVSKIKVTENLIRLSVCSQFAAASHLVIVALAGSIDPSKRFKCLFTFGTRTSIVGEYCMKYVY